MNANKTIEHFVTTTRASPAVAAAAAHNPLKERRTTDCVAKWMRATFYII